ncbi:hypothetical protein OESDEN_20028 [Oesophagostomum dentatum]|uniref:Uncharacterized protein n=1 Tax=Oesophagostomum dentatum TaxID=61180 RepID=A0A0B1S4M0_OESDE|nr:hypothetical protein OESDEN_20028 [Oesophagostomum dentatum]
MEVFAVILLICALASAQVGGWGNPGEHGVWHGGRWSGPIRHGQPWDGPRRGPWDEPWRWPLDGPMIDIDFNEHRNEWIACKEENSMDTMRCFKPKEFNTESYHRDDGWHKNLKCQTSSKTDNVVLSADKYGTPLAIGAGSVSKVVRCNDRSKWVARKGGRREIELKDVFCYTIPGSNN